MCVSLDVVAECLRTVDAAERAAEFLLRCVRIGGALSRGGAIIKVLHHYHQFTMQRFRRSFRLVLLGAAGGGGGDRAGELVWQEVI